MQRSVLRTLSYTFLLIEIVILSVCALFFIGLSVFTKMDYFAQYINKQFYKYSLALYFHNKIEYPPGEL